MPCVLNTCKQGRKECGSLICQQGLHCIDTGEWTHEQVMTTADKVSRIAWAVLMWLIAGIAAACFFFASVGMP